MAHVSGPASAWSGFHRKPRSERLDILARHAGLSADEVGVLAAPSGLPDELGQQFVENAVGAFPLPLGVAVNFVVDGREVAVPMAVEESSVVAAASHGAKLAALGGGFRTQVSDPVTIGQVEVRFGVGAPRPRPPSLASARKVLARHRKAWLAELDALIPTMVARGGGTRGLVVRAVGRGKSARLVLHLLVDTRDAMGANVANTLCEHLAPLAAAALGGVPGLRILSNLADERLATATCRVPADAIGGRAAVDAIVAANELAILDPYRAATHNKGIMNGIDPVLVATGNDWRAVEAGAHAYAARSGAYAALTAYKRTRTGDLEASLTLPLALGTVGGVTRLHPTARACLRLLGEPDARRLAAIVASVGLAQNLAALKALAGEGIQRGHMSLHARNVALAAGAGARAAEVAAAMVAQGNVSGDRARAILAGAGPGRVQAGSAAPKVAANRGQKASTPSRRR